LRSDRVLIYSLIPRWNLINFSENIYVESDVMVLLDSFEHI
jgi:hypothetical protein